MGNGVITDISDIVFIDPDKFDNRFTLDMAGEIALVNEAMVKENRRYILIGPGRWGTNDSCWGFP